jgi:hypothetical protein
VAGPWGDAGYAFALGGAPADGEVYRFATIATNKDDYAPGEHAVITGAGWEPNEEVELVFQEDPAVHPDYVLTVTTDAEGNFTYDQWAPEPHDVGVRFYLMATGSRSRAQISFTDGNLSSAIALTIGGVAAAQGTAILPVTPGAVVSWSLTATCADDTVVVANTCSSEGYVAGGAVQDGYGIVIQRSLNSSFTSPFTVDTRVTTGGAISGSFVAPTSGGPYYYRARHTTQSLANVPVAGSTSNAWQGADSGFVQVRIGAAGPTALAFASAPFTGLVGECLGPIQVQTQNASGQPTVVLGSTVVGLSVAAGPTGAGAFYDNSLCTAPAVAGVTIATGEHSASVYYRASARGTGLHEVTASATGLTSANQTQTINPRALTITANNQTKAPGTSFTFAGTEFTTGAGQLLSGDAVTSVTLTSAGAPASAAPGAYPIVPSLAQGVGLDNYAIAYVDGKLTVGYNVCPQYDPLQAHQPGSTIPLRVVLCDVSGNAVSAPNTVLAATGISSADGLTVLPAAASGNANPGNTFRFSGGVYVYNLSLRNAAVPSGAWKLLFTVNGVASPAYALIFNVR